ncbi:energy transducer TonB [Maribacter sp. X9]|uniref:energy transducer TonB n=1 Tax=Maribacter sp. X9 TaxID=3402159 RepID=UPI003AF3D421
MELKKNPEKDLNRKSNLYFVVGLLLVLTLSFVALEWKSYDVNYEFDISLNQTDENIDEEVPIFELETTPPASKPIIPTEIEIAEDEDPIIETTIDATETTQETEILEAADIEVMEEPDEVEVNWITIEEVPIFPGCEKEKDKRACFNEMMQKHIQKNFRYPEMAQELGLEGRVNTQFIINKDGSIGTIRKRGPHELLEKEAERILSKLPKMTPGKQRGTAVKVPFSIPITFKLQ